VPPRAGQAPLSVPSLLQQEREVYRRRQSLQSGAIAATSTVVFLAVCAFAITRSPGWDRVKEQFFSWDVAVASLPRILDGLLLNLRVLAFSAVLTLLLALLLAAMRTLRGPVWFPLRLASTVYTDLFRGFPLIIVLYIVGFGVPGLRLEGVPTSPAVLGTIALTMTYGAYVAEVFRAGIEAVHPSQRAAARSLGLSHAQTMRLVVLPQAVRKVTPPLLNDFVAMQKDVGLISILGAVDAVRAAQIEVAQSFNFTPYLVAGLLFVALAVPSARLADWASARVARREQASGVA
jgi:polar amino acid transport system permease protein